ncbi:putative GMP synthase [glutamine-hydrolyzing] [Gossypium arboreum]|uniref:Putative GMP synthase [glutamine-hydrolyzing] n=1 Tax=Gossypium arboreum TaxID=29729 RepID=A0A0B0MEH6_GOSAR|nr:putative GMP synthase [glutamine-hydrolyzing] [Gossypium arboreum]KHG09720.1 putative GMP synthase [glutamine-hydrolyzing] [Gossypium arboreum]
MSGPPRVRSANTATEMEARSVLGPAGNKVPTKPAPKSTKKQVQQTPEGKDKEKVKELLTPQKKPTPAPQSLTLTASILRQQERMAGNFSMSLSCLSDGGASSSSAGSSSSGMTGGGGRRGGKHGIGVGVRRKQSGPKGENGVIVVDSWEGGCLDNKKRCGWVTTNSGNKTRTQNLLCIQQLIECMNYLRLCPRLRWNNILFLIKAKDSRDVQMEGFGLKLNGGLEKDRPRKLFELLSLSGALAELTWPTILSKRHLFRDTFLEFDPRAVIDEFGSFDKYIWSFVNHKPIVGQFRYPRQVPVKSPKSEVISKDLIRRGFRSVGPTVVYSFMQVAGLTNDHLMSCFRFQECITGVESRGKVNNDEANDETKKVEETTALG